MVAPLIAAGARAGGSRVISGSAKRSYAERYTDEKLAKKRKLIAARREKQQEKDERGRVATSRNYAPTTRAARYVNPLQVGKSAIDLIGDAALKARTAMVSAELGVSLTGMYFGIQLPLYLFGLMFFVAAFFDMVMTLGVFTAFAIGLNGINTGICWAFMAFAAFSYSMAGVNWFGGKKANLKMLFFMMAFVGYGATLFQFIPWAIPWMLVVALNPE